MTIESFLERLPENNTTANQEDSSSWGKLSISSESIDDTPHANLTAQNLQLHNYLEGGSSCKHICCREGLDKPPTEKRVAQSGNPILQDENPIPPPEREHPRAVVPHEAQQALHRAVNYAAQQPDVTKALSDAVTERRGDVTTHEVRQVLLQAVNHAVQHPDVTKSLSNTITKELGSQVEDGLSHTLSLRPGASLSQTR